MALCCLQSWIYENKVYKKKSTKAKLTTILAESLLAYMSNFNIVVVYGTKIKGHSIETEHSHEEADKLIPNQVLDSLNFNEVCVWSPDTDVVEFL